MPLGEGRIGEIMHAFRLAAAAVTAMAAITLTTAPAGAATGRAAPSGQLAGGITGVTGPIFGEYGDCLDDKYGGISSGNTVWLYPCNGTIQIVAVIVSIINTISRVTA